MSNHQADILISKIIDGDATEAHWAELVILAEQDGGVWRDLAESQHDQQVLSRTINAAVSVSERVHAPVNRFDPDELAGRGSRGRKLPASAWSGWAVAAVVGLAAFANNFGLSTQTGNQTSIISSAEDAFKEYLRLGQKNGEVVGELPSRVMVSSKPAPDGNGYEVVYLRQVLEVQIVPDLYEFAGQNDQGQPTLVPFQPQTDEF